MVGATDTVNTGAAPTSGDSQQSVPRTAMDLVRYFRQQATDARSVGQTEFAAHLEQRARVPEEGTLQNVLSYERDVEATRLRDWEGERGHYRDWQLENQRQVIGLGQSAIRWFAVINAGAVVALLAFLGNVWTKGVVLGPFLVAMRAFATGVVLAAFAGSLSYLTQLLYGAESEKAQNIAKVLHVFTILVGLGSLAIFCIGSYQSMDAFRQQDSRQPTAVLDTTAVSKPEERRNYPPPKRAPAEPPRPVVPAVPSNPNKGPSCVEGAGVSDG